MYAPSKRSSFKRTTERKVVDPNERLVVEADRRRNRELQAFEEVGFSAAAASVLVTEPSFEDLYGRMEAEDTSRFDVEGRVY